MSHHFQRGHAAFRAASRLRDETAAEKVVRPDLASSNAFPPTG